VNAQAAPIPADLCPVSINDHLIEPASTWSELPKRFRSLAPALVEQSDGSAAWRFGDGVVPLGFLTLAAGRHIEHRPAALGDVPLAAWEPAARVKAMDDDGVHVHTVFPNCIGFAGEQLVRLDQAVATACAQAYNDFVIDGFCSYAPERLVAVAVLPLSDISTAVTEVKRVRDAGARGVSLPIVPDRNGLPSWHSGYWDDVFAACAHAGLPVFMHIGGTGVVRTPPDSPLGVFLTAANFDALNAVAELAYSPVLAANPNLRVVIVEAGVAWIPYMEERVDFFWDRHRAATHGPRTPGDLPPSARLGAQVLASFITDRSIAGLGTGLAVDRLLWQSDYPHADSLWPRSVEAAAASLGGLDEDGVRAVLELNGRKMLGLERPESWQRRSAASAP
jgi:predicted TIM-barrel fold metal-dependent hydrolase